MRKIPIKSISLQKRNIYSNVSQTVCRDVLWYAASLSKVLYTDTNFLPKLRKCCHEVMVNNCYKSRAALQVTVREVKTFFSETSTISSYITRFSEIVAQRSGDLQIMPWLVFRKI